MYTVYACDGGWWGGENGPVLDTFSVSCTGEKLTAFFFFFLDVNVVDLPEKKLFLMACSSGIIAAVCCLELELTSTYEHKTAFLPSGSKLLPVLLLFRALFFFVRAAE